MYIQFGTLMAFASSLMILFVREIFPVFIDSRYHAGLWITPVVGIAYYFDSLSLLAESGIYTAKKTALLPFICGFGALANIALNIMLIPIIGIMGAAIATLATYIVLTVVYLRIGQRLLPVSIPWRVIAAQLAVIGGTLGLSFLLDSFILRLLVALLSGGVCLHLIGGIRALREILYSIRK